MKKDNVTIDHLDIRVRVNDGPTQSYGWRIEDIPTDILEFLCRESEREQSRRRDIHRIATNPLFKPS